MTGPVPRHDHQTLDQWAQQGLVNTEGRPSPESDLPPGPDGVGTGTTADPDAPAGRSAPDDGSADPSV